MQPNFAEHLAKPNKIQMGGYYTPRELVDKVYDFIQPYLIRYKKKLIIFDNAGGCGAFLSGIQKYEYRIADYDSMACQYLKRNFDNDKIFCSNSLLDVNRLKYLIPSSSILIMIGNPPYNDTTSEFRNGEKGINLCDDDLTDRDTGISFLKSYDKLKADIVCVLHPLSYLIKEANFKRLRSFKENYHLIKGEIFSSSLFEGTGSAKFPILIALYERNTSGMTFEHIYNFKFDVLAGNNKFTLSKYKTTDGYINKYPPRKNDMQESPIGLYYYTFRDINSLKKNTSFMTIKHYNGIVVTLENFYKYAYLYSFKNLFNPENAWLYGNISPLGNSEEIEKDKELYILYAVKKHPIIGNMANNILRLYGIRKNNNCDISKIKKIMNRLI